MDKKRYKIEAECPECGCGLIENMAPDVWREKHGKTAGGDVEVVCPECGKKHMAHVEETEE